MSEPTIPEQLGSPPDSEHLSTRSGGGGISLTYLEGQYVIAKMNEIFGPGGWKRTFAGNGLHVVDQQTATPPNKTKPRHDVSMLCEYRVTAFMGDDPIHVEDVGYGVGQSYISVGDAFESASKEAVTDALKRCCRSLGNAMGNCLYDKKWLAANKGGRQEGAGRDGASETQMDGNGEMPDPEW